MTDPKTTPEHGPQTLRLITRLFGDPDKRLINFNVWWGPDAANMTVEERAAAIMGMLDSSRRVEPGEIDGRAPKVDIRGWLREQGIE